MAAINSRSQDPGMTTDPPGPGAGDFILTEWQGAYGVHYPELFLVEPRPGASGSRMRSLGLCELQVISPTGSVVREEVSDGFQIQLLEHDSPRSTGLITVWLDKGFPTDQIKITGQIRHRGAINVHGSDATDYLLWMRRRAATVAAAYTAKANLQNRRERHGHEHD